MAIQDFQTPYEIELNRDNQGNPINITISSEPHVIYDSQVLLAQIPDEFFKVSIFNKYEKYITQPINNTNEYKVDYTNGVVYFHPDLEGTTITINIYSGRGIKLLYASRVKLEDLDNLFTSINVEGGMKELAQRLNNLLQNTQQASEVVDARIDANTGINYSILKNRLDTEYGEIYNARTNSISTTPVVHSNLKVRLDTEYQEISNKIGDLSTSTTTEKSSVVGITNEIKSDFNSHLAENVSITTYGAAKNTDSTTAIQNAINYVANNGGGKVHIPSGIFNISAKLTCPSNVFIVGTGSSELHAIAAIDAIIDLAGQMENIYINGNNLASKGVQTTGDYCYLKRCVFAYCIYGIYNIYDTHRFINCSIQNCTYGIYSADRFINSFIYGLTAQNNQYGIYITYSAQQPQSLFITHSLFFGNSVRGIFIEKDIFVLSITDCIFDGSQPRSIMLSDLTTNLGADITIKNCYVGATEVPIYLGCGYNHITIDNNRIDNGSYYGLLSYASTTVRNANLTITNNSFNANITGDINVNSVLNCLIERNNFGMVSGTNIVVQGDFTGTKPKVIIRNNTMPATGRISEYNTIMSDNVGDLTNSNGLGAIGNGFSSVTVTHGLDRTPTIVMITPYGNLGNIWVTDITATQFTVHSSIAASGDIPFSWSAQL